MKRKLTAHRKFSWRKISSYLTVITCGLAVSACDPNQQSAMNGDGTDSEERVIPRPPGTQAKHLASYTITADPVSQTFDIVRDESVDPPGSLQSALANGDEAVAVSSDIALANCSAGTCGCVSGDVPSWKSGACSNGGVFGTTYGQGHVTLTNNSSTNALINPALIFEAVSPSSLQFWVADPPVSCAGGEATQVRSVAPYNGNVYIQYDDLAPSGVCHKGSQAWAAQPDVSGDQTATHVFNVHVYVDSLAATDVLNGTFESGTTNWTLSGTAAALGEHCSTTNPLYDCGLTGGDGILPPSGSGNMLRLINNDSGTSNITSAVTNQISLQSGTTNLTFKYKMGSFEPNGCLSTRNDEFYVEVRDVNEGVWRLVPFSDPPDDSGDDDDRIGVGESGTNHDCAEFGALNASDVAENTWYPFSGLQTWATRTYDIDSITGIDAGDLIEIRFTVQGGGTNTNAANSVFLVDDVDLGS